MSLFPEDRERLFSCKVQISCQRCHLSCLQESGVIPNTNSRHGDLFELFQRSCLSARAAIERVLKTFWSWSSEIKAQGLRSPSWLLPLWKHFPTPPENTWPSMQPLLTLLGLLSPAWTRMPDQRHDQCLYWYVKPDWHLSPTLDSVEHVLLLHVLCPFFLHKHELTGGGNSALMTPFACTPLQQTRLRVSLKSTSLRKVWLLLCFLEILRTENDISGFSKW